MAVAILHSSSFQVQFPLHFSTSQSPCPRLLTDLQKMETSGALNVQRVQKFERTVTAGHILNFCKAETSRASLSLRFKELETVRSLNILKSAKMRSISGLTGQKSNNLKCKCRNIGTFPVLESQKMEIRAIGALKSLKAERDIAFPTVGETQKVEIRASVDLKWLKNVTERAFPLSSMRKMEVFRAIPVVRSGKMEFGELEMRESIKTKKVRGSKVQKSGELEMEKSAIKGDDQSSEVPKTTRRGRKKGSGSTSATISARKTRRSKKSEPKLEAKQAGDEEFDDGMDFPYESPPLICCFGAAQREFVPAVRIADRQMHPDIYSTWKGLQWSPPEFARAPGGPPSNVAISHVRLGGRAAFMGKVGDDKFGEELIYTMNTERVQTRAVKIDPSVKTAVSYMNISFQDGKLRAKPVKECAEDSLLSSEVNIAVLKEARIFHFNSEVLTSPSMHSALFRAIELSKKFGGLIFFDLNLPLPLWRSRDETREVIKEAWNQANIIEVTKQELEFLLDEAYYEKKRNYRPQYYAENYEQTKKRRDYYHYTKEEISPLWHDNVKMLFVTDGTLRIHFYSPLFDGVVVGTEDVLITPYTCDRTGSGDAIVAAIMRKLTIHPEMFEDQDELERELRFAIAAGIISQWTIGAVRGFPTESATQNLKEQVYVPSMW